MDLTTAKEIGLLIAVGAMIGVLVYTFWRRNQPTFDRARHLPLRDDEALDLEEANHDDEARDRNETRRSDREWLGGQA